MCVKMVYNYIYLEYIPISNGKFQQCKNCNYFCTNLTVPQSRCHISRAEKPQVASGHLSTVLIQNTSSTAGSSTEKR